jgi:subtilase family serine protease
MTALVLKVFASYNGIFDLQDEINDAVAYLLTRQNTDGGFGADSSTVYETALSFMALTESGQDGALALQNAINYLYANQLPDGSWNDDPYSTALALRALVSVKPDLTISSSDITFSDSTPTVGDTVTITANIRNTGSAQADNVLIQFYNGDPDNGGTLIDETTVSIIPAFDSAQVSINWTTSAVSTVTIFVKVDALNTIDELDETDNYAIKNIYVGTGVNLTVSNIVFTPEVAVVDQPVDITFTITNSGETTANSVLVEYYHAESTQEEIYSGTLEPEQYIKIGETTISELSPGMNYPIQITKSFTQGFHNIKVIADPLNTISETNESDNEFSKWITALPGQIDLIVNSNIIISPNNPKENDDITVFALAYNYGSITADSVVVALYDGDPSSGGIKIDEQIMDMAPLDYKQLEFHINLLQGVHDIYIVLDPMDTIAEADEANNQAMKSITVDMASNVDFSITAEEIVFTPSQSLPGDNVTITATIHNLGSQTETTSVSFYEGNPSFGGTKIQDSTVTVPGNGTSNVNINYTVGNKPTIIFVLLDEADTVYEKNEENNIAFKKLIIGLPDLVIRDKDIKINRMSDGSIYISPLIRNMGGVDVTDVSISLYDGNPSSGGIFIANQIIDSISSGSGRRINVPYTLEPGRHDLYVIVDPENQIKEITEANNSAMKVVHKTDPNGPDIAVTHIDSSNITTNTQTLTVDGVLNITLENTSVIDITVPFILTAYEDLNKNAIYDSGIDNKLGEITVNDGLNASAVNTYSINISGQVKFRDNHIHVMADSNNAIIENNEENNDRHHKEDCTITPQPVDSFEVIEEWAWMGSDFEPTKNQVRMSPVVANMNDDNGDGIIDEDDIPDVIFVSQEAMITSQGILRIISGKDGKELVSIGHPEGIKSYLMGIAVGDIDNDGDPEIVVPLQNNREIVAYNHDGSLLWTSETVPYPYIGGVAPLIADIDNDGNPEIYQGRVLFNNRGEILWRHVFYSHANLVPIAVDLKGNDIMEIVSSSYAYNSDGTTYWFNSFIGSMSGFNAIGNFDEDPYPEVIYSGTGRVDLLEHDKPIIWTFNDLNYRYELQSAPAIGDVDEDSEPEIAVAGHNKFTLFNGNGILRWEAPVYDSTGGIITPVFFDLNGDGKAEIAVNDGKNFFIFNGETGEVLFSIHNPASTGYEIPAVADVDNDGQVEFIVFGGIHQYNDPYYGGIRVFGEKNGNWISSRRIWNQHSYHVTNIDEDGYIPLREEDSWKIYNCYRCNVPIDNALDTPDLTVSRILLSENNFPEYVTITARIGNAGTLLAREGTSVSFYDGDPADGGILIGTVSTSRRLNPGEFEDISLSWHYPVEGTHDVYVVVDPEEKVKECDEQNNIASTQITVGEIALPDLIIIPSNIMIIPPETIEGQPAIITALIHNAGDIGASDVVVSFYDGDPQSGGMLIDTVTISHINSAEDAIADITWDTMGQTGINYIHVVIDPENLIEESNENNNSSLIQVEVTPPQKPDLTIKYHDIAFSNLNPQEGDPLTISATIHNLGIETGNIEVYLYDGDPSHGGILLSQKTIFQIIPFGEEITLNFDIETVGLAGSHDFYISIDPDNTIDEISEANNIAWNSLDISDAGVNLGISTDKTTYTANEDVQITLNIENLFSHDRSGNIDIKILDMYDHEVSIITSSQALTLGINENKILNYTWNTGEILYGSYIVYCQFIEGSRVVANAFTQIAIFPVEEISSKVATDRISYTSNQIVIITSTITSLSTNFIFEDLIAKVSVVNDQGEELYVEIKSIPVLIPGQMTELKIYWYTEQFPPGNYNINLDVENSIGEVISTSNTSFQILDSSQTGDSITGTVSVNPSIIEEGQSVTITYTITNRTNTDITNFTGKILIVDPDIQTVIDSKEEIITLIIDDTYTGQFIFSTQDYEPKSYAILLQYIYQATQKVIAGTSFKVIAPPVADAGSDQNVVTGEPVTLDGSGSYDPEGEIITFLWRFIEVPSGSSITDTSLSDPASVRPVFTPDVNGTYALELTVSDGQLQDSDTVSIFASTPNVPPNADAGADQNVYVGDTVYLDGTASSDPDDGPELLSYLWSLIEVPQGSGLTDNDITGRDQARANFIPDLEGTYVLNLWVYDGEDSDNDEIIITATMQNVPPNADAGMDISITLGETAYLDGKGSNDPDNWPEGLSYQWRFVSVPGGSSLTNSNIIDANTATPSFIPDVEGIYVLELMVSDGEDTDFDNVVVTVVVSSGCDVQGDLDGDCDVDRDDLNILLLDRNKSVEDSSCGEPCDLDNDGVITVLDARKLILLCTRPRCVTE